MVLEVYDVPLLIDITSRYHLTKAFVVLVLAIALSCFPEISRNQIIHLFQHILSVLPQVDFDFIIPKGKYVMPSLAITQ